MTKGEDLINRFIKAGERNDRAFCSKCGTRLFRTFADKDLMAVFPDLFEKNDRSTLPESVLPSKNFWGNGCVLRQNDVLKAFL